MDKHGYQLGLIELTGVYVTPCTKYHLDKLSAQNNMSIGQLLGRLIDKAHCRMKAEDFKWNKGIHPEKQKKLG